MGRPFIQVPDLRQAWVVLHLNPVVYDNTFFRIYVEGTFPDAISACEACKRCRGSKAYVLKEQTLPAIPLADQNHALLEFKHGEEPEVVACFEDREQGEQAKRQAEAGRTRWLGMIRVRTWMVVGSSRSSR